MRFYGAVQCRISLRNLDFAELSESSEPFSLQESAPYENSIGKVHLTDAVLPLYHSVLLAMLADTVFGKLKDMYSLVLLKYLASRGFHFVPPAVLLSLKIQAQLPELLQQGFEVPL